MFRKREKKTFPPGTFIPTPARVCAIIQLCLAFTIILWHMAQPFSGELFGVKSNLLLYQDVMGIPSHDNPTEEKLSRLKHNHERFQALPSIQKQEIATGYQAVQKELQRTFLDKFIQSWHVLAFEIPAFEQAWLFFSVIISILLLKRVEGAAFAVWLLPLLTALYAFDSRWEGVSSSHSEAHLYPTELILVTEYLDKPLSDNIFEQKDELQKAWQLYLIKDWAKQEPADDPTEQKLQAEQGEFAFNIMRIEWRSHNKPDNHPGKTPYEPLWVLTLYLFWNTYFAYTAWRNCY